MKPDCDDETSTTQSLQPSSKDAQPVAVDTKLAAQDAPAAPAPNQDGDRNAAPAPNQHGDRNIADASVPHTAPGTTTLSQDDSAAPHAAAAPRPSPDATHTSASVAAGLALELPVAPILHHAPKRYQIIAAHGQGGLGRVSRAHDRDLQRDVAIKELIARNQLAEARFLREAMITARLEHPGIVPVHEAGRWPDGTPFYAMKLVAGRPLRDLIAERKTVDERIGLLHHVIAVADAIAYAHGRNIIHRDLKPANVIVGDFGETVVIDWGLAKDLSAADFSLDPEAESPATSSQSPATSLSLRITSVDDLTTTGSVLGTPAYMPPEQERGEHVDQRADVFAIGAMLWELCSLQKVPPTEPRLRHRLLRRADIDRDLVTILDKALARDPALRYPDAGALAADLKAFKAGARISARTYSLAASIAHWTRHHRALSISFTLFIALLLAGGLFYTHRITQQQHQTQRALERAETSEHELSGAHADLTLKHAELLLGTDPSAAADTLDTYHGTDTTRLERLRADARGLGIATLRATPHRNGIRWAAERSDGSIVSLSIDGTIARTTGDGRSEVLFHGVSPRGRFAASKNKKIIAYGCDPAALCLWAWDEPASKPVIVVEGVTLAGIALAPSALELSAITYDGKVHTFDIHDIKAIRPARPVMQSEGAAIVYFDNRTLALATKTGLQLLDDNGFSTVKLSETYLWDWGPSNGLFALGATSGTSFIVQPHPWRLTSATKLCADQISALRAMPSSQKFGFACKDGTLGLWEPASKKVDVLTRIAGRPYILAFSDDGEYLAADAENGSIAILNLKTGLMSLYRGHGIRLAVLSLSNSSPDSLLSADSNGTVRMWSLPDSNLTVGAKLGLLIHSVSFLPRSHTAILTSYREDIVIISPELPDILLAPHRDNLLFTTVANDGDTIATYGHNETVEIWSLKSRSQIRQLRTTQGAVSQLAFQDDGDIVLAGRSGQITRWHKDGLQEIVADLRQPIEDFAIANVTGVPVVATTDGAIWSIDRNQGLNRQREQGGAVLQLSALNNSSGILAALGDGSILYLDPLANRVVSLRPPGPSPLTVKVSKSNYVIAYTRSEVFYARLPSHPSAQLRWERLAVELERLDVTSDDILIGISKDNMVRAFSLNTRRWWSGAVPATELLRINLAPDERYAVIADAGGRAMWLDVSRVRTQLAKEFPQNGHR